MVDLVIVQADIRVCDFRDLGEGLKCYICDGQNSDCVNSLGKSEDCPLMTTTTQSSTNPTTKSTQPTTISTTEPTQPSTNPTTESTQPSTNPTTESTQPSTNPTTESTQPSTNPTTESTQPSTNPTTESTQSSTKSTTTTTTNSLKQGPELDFIDNDWLKEGENITYECVEARLTTLNGTTLKNEVYRGCTPKNLVSCSRIPISDIQVKSCVIRTCETDNCNSSSMEKMGIISLLLPLITALLRIR
ncbi:mucin-2-like [Polistes fuscatus]|uniref:mucin-2-like n=1 Tax=Polistes fuscatus TaxID=30207 RepID=UPI001CA7F313|nr:mucin-2-like [Polistes fuscatus]